MMKPEKLSRARTQQERKNRLVEGKSGRIVFYLSPGRELRHFEMLNREAQYLGAYFPKLIAKNDRTPNRGGGGYGTCKLPQIFWYCFIRGINSTPV